MTVLLTAAITGAPPTHPDTWDRLLAGLDASDLATIVAALAGAVAAVAAAVIAAAVAVRAYRRQQAETRRQKKATFYAEAVRAVEDYAEAPYRIRRRDGTPAARRELTQHLSDVKSRISFYTAWMAIHGTNTVATAYDAYVAAARTESGQQMTTAWRSKPTRRDRDVPLGTPLPRARTDRARGALLAAMKADLGR